MISFKNKFYLYFATRDTAMKIQMIGVATAPVRTNFNRDQWTQAADKPILYPQLDWEGACIEGASVIQRGNRLFMFYAGAYNNAPQQIGLAVSKDGVTWERVSQVPFVPNGKPGEWNSSESGHPHIFRIKMEKRTCFTRATTITAKPGCSRRKRCCGMGKPSNVKVENEKKCVL
ncbi:hypothetical protein [Chitinophaga sedimenti]|uniref:hypothetical protein n=1 Tax=Chitinophaga sedimenti TaxID=2033606 RepID=UPI0027E20D92|nr:hypothetical protein [Chitinophaga sedimenti]